MASTTGLREAGWSRTSLLVTWVSIAVVSGLAAAFGYDTMMPDAFEHGGPLAGVVTTVGFGAGFALTTL
jgi:ZIP family zinc transporter